MATNRDQTPLSKDDLLARVVGDACEHDAEDILFWRNASEQLRGKTLYCLRARGKVMFHSVPHLIEQQNDAVRLVLRPHSIEFIADYERISAR